MSTWLRYLAIVVLVGNGFTTLWNLIALGKMIQGSLDSGIGLLALNLTFSLAAIALAALIVATVPGGVSLTTKIIAVPSILGGGIGVLSVAMWFYSRMDQPRVNLSTDRLAVELFVTEKAVQNLFFSACTLALAILVLTSHRRSA